MMFLSNDMKLMDIRLITAKECDNNSNIFGSIEFKGIKMYADIQLGKILVLSPALMQSIDDDDRINFSVD